jgi:hypothetical protein
MKTRAGAGPPAPVLFTRRGPVARVSAARTLERPSSASRSGEAGPAGVGSKQEAARSSVNAAVNRTDLAGGDAPFLLKGVLAVSHGVDAGSGTGGPVSALYRPGEVGCFAGLWRPCSGSVRQASLMPRRSNRSKASPENARRYRSSAARTRASRWRLSQAAAV